MSDWDIDDVIINNSCRNSVFSWLKTKPIINNKRFDIFRSVCGYAVVLSVLISQPVITTAFAQSTYEIFITEAQVQAEPGVTVYHIREGDNLLATINLKLKQDQVTDEQTAAAYVTQQLQDRLVVQMTGLTKAAQYRLKYFPAIVKDSRYVIYGTTNLKAFDGIAH